MRYLTKGYKILVRKFTNPALLLHQIFTSTDYHQVSSEPQNQKEGKMSTQIISKQTQKNWWIGAALFASESAAALSGDRSLRLHDIDPTHNQTKKRKEKISCLKNLIDLSPDPGDRSPDLRAVNRTQAKSSNESSSLGGFGRGSSEAVVTSELSGVENGQGNGGRGAVVVRGRSRRARCRNLPASG